jgi:hypothetical protein
MKSYKVSHQCAFLVIRVEDGVVLILGFDFAPVVAKIKNLKNLRKVIFLLIVILNLKLATTIIFKQSCFSSLNELYIEL